MHDTGDPAGPGPRQAGRVRRAARRARSATRSGVRSGARAARRGWVGMRRATHAHGAGESGLAGLIELHGVSSGADALVAVALANTLFFDVPIGEARGRVLLYLLLTMVPFAVLAPVIGPLLDRLRRGRRWALAATFAGRGLLAYGLVGVVEGRSLRLYPLAFGVLILSRAYGVGRMAMVPRLLPRGIGLVRANSRISLAGIATGSAAAPLGLLLSRFTGPAPVLWVAVAVFAVGAVLAARLPRRADAAPVAHDRAGADGEDVPPRPRRLRGVRGPVVLALRANAALRALSGFLIFYLAFLVRERPEAGVDSGVAIALVIGGAALGGMAGTWLGERLRRLPPEHTVVAAVAVAAAAAAAAALLFGVVAVTVAAALAGGAQALGKLSLDAIVQREVPESVRSSAFARSETLLQVAWVLGATLGTLLAVPGPWGFTAAATGLAAASVLAFHDVRRLRRSPRGAARSVAR